MNDNMNMLVVMQAVAIYLHHPKGVVAAIAFLISHGMSKDEAVDCIALYDGYVTLAAAGKL